MISNPISLNKFFVENINYITFFFTGNIVLRRTFHLNQVHFIVIVKLKKFTDDRYALNAPNKNLHRTSNVYVSE